MRCEEGCGLLFPLLVAREAGGALSCLGCGARARVAREGDVLDEMERRIRALVPEGKSREAARALLHPGARASIDRGALIEKLEAAAEARLLLRALEGATVRAARPPG